MATSNKYDRQLRLWGSDGQQALMESSILLVNANGVGSESLKNLVLPGVGSFTILDDSLVSESDLGNNFFVHPDYLNRPRAEVVCELLLEMNSDVKGSAKVASLSSILITDPGYFSQFSLVIACNVEESLLLPLAATCALRLTPLLIVRSYGLVGYFRLQIFDHGILQSRPDSSSPDLRLSAPFPELRALVDSYTEEAQATMDSLELSHIPYIVLLVKCLDDWKAKSNGSVPKTMKEKDEFRALLKQHAVAAAARCGSSGVSVDWLNYSEAVREAHHVWSSPSALPETVIELVDGQRTTNLTASSSKFSYLLKALQLFLDETGVPPLPGNIPDMTSTTTQYTSLQAAYSKRAAADRARVSDILLNLLQTFASSPLTELPAVEWASQVDLLCRHAAHLHLVTSRTLAQEYSGSGHGDEETASAVREATLEPYEMDSLQTPVAWYAALRAADKFQSSKGRWPGSKTTSVDADAEIGVEFGSLSSSEINDRLLAADAAIVWKTMKEMTAGWGVDPAALTEGETLDADMMDSSETSPSRPIFSERHAREITRFAGEEVHVISAVLGGICAQEAVKVLTHQYLPLDNTYIYNGVTGVGAVYKF